MFDLLCSYGYIATVKTGSECQLSAHVLLLGMFSIVACCAEVLFQPSFLVSLNALPGVLHAERSPKLATEPDTAQT